MIHFRFHVVSIIAVFLAIAIGTVMGATFVGRGVIDRLQSRIDTVEADTKAARANNDKLTGEINTANQYIDESAPLAVDGTLTGVVVVLVAQRGIDAAIVEAQAQTLRGAGASVPGIIWLEDSWSLAESSEPDALRAATGLTNRSRSALRSAAAQALGQRLAGPAPVDDVLATLADQQFVTLAGVAGSPTPVPTDFTADEPRMLIVGGPTGSGPASVVTDVASGIVAVGGRVAIGEVFVPTDESGDRNEWIDGVVDTDLLRNRVSTVNDVELTEGRVASTLVLAAVAAGQVGNYGPGRDRAIPDVPLPVTPSAR